MRRALLALAVIVSAHTMYGQCCGTEYQARLLAHIQHVPTENSIGFAGWAILPNVMNTAPFRTYTLAGVAAKSNQRWAELMGGVRIDSHGAVETTLDIRMLDQSMHWLDMFAEIEYSFTTRQWYFSPILTTPLANGSVGIKAGAEFDLFLHPQRSSIFYGPRVSIHFPVGESIVRNVAFATAYRFQINGEPVIRQYLLLNF